MRNNPSSHQGDDLPVEMVSWYDAIDFCNRLSAAEGFAPCYVRNSENVAWRQDADGYRLPTVDEWEYAARGGPAAENYRYAGSDEIVEVAWCVYNSRGTTHPVGLKKPNCLGLYDMSGNVWEWCWDDSGAGRDAAKVYRGGSFLDFDYACAVTARGRRLARLRQNDIGVRLARGV